MKINLNQSNQTEYLEARFKQSLYGKLHTISCRTHAIRLCGALIGSIAALSHLVKRVALIAENLLKGTVNFLGSPFFETCKLSKGLIQLFLITPFHIAALPFVIFYMPCTILANTIGIAIIPQRFTNFCRKNYLTQPEIENIIAIERERCLASLSLHDEFNRRASSFANPEYMDLRNRCLDEIEYAMHDKKAHFSYLSGVVQLVA